MRSRLAVILVVLASLLMNAKPALADPSFMGSGPDAYGDVSNPDGDILGTHLQIDGANITIDTLVNHQGPAEYKTLPGWASPNTKFGWEVDTNNDGRPDYDIQSTPFTINSGLASGYATVTQHGTGIFMGTAPLCISICGMSNIGGSYILSNFPLSELGNPATVAVYPTLQWDADPTHPGANETFDIGQLTASVNGAWLLGADGGVFTYGGAHFYGSTGGMKLNKPVVGMALNPSHTGYWTVASDGGVFSFNTDFFGSAGDVKLNKPIVGMTPTSDGRGYWLVASDGGIFAYGDAKFYGSTGSTRLNAPIVGMASTNSGNGYWLVASDGGIFAYGDAKFYGSTGSNKLNQPIVGMAASPNPLNYASSNPVGGYYLIAKDGGVFNYNAPFYGSAASATNRSGAVVGMSASYQLAYTVATSTGQLFNYTYNSKPINIGDAGNLKLNAPIVAMVTDDYSY